EKTGALSFTRGLLARSLTKHMVRQLPSAGTCSYRAYAAFCKNYDATRDFEAMEEAGVLESTQIG
uniref:Uncharacterized protein n=1 Tax=Varanus komodoensis TaxID=61221 RepID=A0A8D2JDL3_VARKO